MIDLTNEGAIRLFEAMCCRANADYTNAYRHYKERQWLSPDDKKTMHEVEHFYKIIAPRYANEVIAKLKAEA